MYHFIVNPASKTGKGKKIWDKIEIILKDRGIDYETHLSEYAGHTSIIAKELCEKYLISGNEDILKLIVLGGDGTLNETLQGITDFKRVLIGYIPTGSSNDMARDLLLPKNPVKCLENILNCKEPVKSDLGILHYNNSTSESSRLHSENASSQRFFDVSCGIGYDAAVCEEALNSPIKNFLNKFGLGKLVYLFIALKQLAKLKRCDAVITLDDNETISIKNFIFVAGMIHQYEGGGFMFAPGTDYSDGLLDICAVGDLSKSTILKALPTALKGKHFKYDGITRYSATKITIETSTPCWVHTDGEVSVKTSSITMSCQKCAIQLLM